MTITIISGIIGGVPQSPDQQVFQEPSMKIISAIIGLAFLEAEILAVIWFLTMPGFIASRRGSPRALAIGALGVFGSIFFGIGWVAALVWAFVEPIQPLAIRPLTNWWRWWIVFPPAQLVFAFIVQLMR